MKKFLRDIIKEKQVISEEALVEIFKVPKELTPDIKEELIVVYHCANKLFSIQVAYNTTKCNSNNNYLVFVFNQNDELLFHVGIASLFPFVWEREFLPYRDLINIQNKINQILKENKLPEINFVDV